MSQFQPTSEQIERLQAEMEADIEQARKLLLQEKRYLDVKRHSHKVIQWTLIDIMHKHGKEASNQLVEECGLEGVGYEKL